MPTSLAASFKKPCKETTVEEFVSRFSQQWNYIQRSEGQIFFYFEYSSKDPNPKIRWESVLDFFIAQDFFL